MVKLVDRYGRRISYLRISVTDRCNLRCLYCQPDLNIISKKRQEILNYEEIIKIVQTVVPLGINKIRITGGEPLIRKNIVDLINSLTKIKSVKDVSLTTNGVFLSEYVQDLKKAGLKRINVSLDTLEKEKYKLITGVDALNKVLDGIKKALQVGLNPVKINVVVMKGINDDEVIEFAKLTLTEPYHVRFIELMPVNQIITTWLKERFVSNIEVKKYCQILGRLQKVEQSDDSISSIYRFKNAKGTVSFISPISEPFCYRCSRLRLTCEGRLRLCLGSSEEINLMPIIRSTTYSQVTADRIKQVFKLAVSLKPKEHCFNFGFNITNIVEQTTMCQIGG